MGDLMKKDQYTRNSIRAELAEMWDRLNEKPSERPSASATLDALSTAIQALDAIDRVELLSNSLGDGPIGQAIGGEIRKALERTF